mgnify:CR=1 FL=1
MDVMKKDMSLKLNEPAQHTGDYQLQTFFQADLNENDI